MLQAVLSVPTLQVIIVPQAVGLLPWMALTGWATFYLEVLQTNLFTAKLTKPLYWMALTGWATFYLEVLQTKPLYC
jgi:hypothetical protein